MHQYGTVGQGVPPQALPEKMQAQKEAEYARHEREHKMMQMLNTFQLATQFRHDAQAMAEFRLWARSKRAEFDNLIDMIGG